MKSKLKSHVEDILKRFPKTRDNDVVLATHVWITHYPESFKKIEDELYIKVSDMLKIPKQSNIQRIRAKFQEEGMYMTIDPKVRKARRQSEESWRQAMNNFNE